MKKRIIISSVITMIVLSSLLLPNIIIKEENKISLNTENLISYTIDGEMAKEKPSKESGYIANKITCKNNSNIVWDNDNWQVEMNAESLDRCTVDFTKDTSREGYRVTVTSNNPSSLDSLSKTTVNGGTIIIYPKGGTIVSVTGCNGEVVGNKVVVRNITENQICNITVKQTLADAILNKYDNITERTGFSIAFKTTGLYKTTDYDASGSFTGTSYYYTGNPDNWVSFAGKLWRIIRINGDNSIRLLYAGTGGEDGYLTPSDITNSSEVGMDSTGRIVYNSFHNDPLYVGWKYGTSGSLENNRTNENKSNAYQAVENWYQNNVVSAGLEKYISKTAVYCNDRSLVSGALYSLSEDFKFRGGAYLEAKQNPSFECDNVSDSFFDGFGLLHASEISFAGLRNNQTSTFSYLVLNASNQNFIPTGMLFWTMSPYSFGNSTSYITAVSADGVVQGNATSTSLYIRPVISISGEYSEGDGSSSNPYKIVMD